MTKLSRLHENEWVEHSHPPHFTIVGEDLDEPRIIATAPAGDPLVIEQLSSCLTPPYVLLYVLHTPRGEGPAGRYQSPAIELDELREFTRQFGEFLRNDGRYDLWVHSGEDGATLVWDRHNLVHAYGPLERLAAKLRGLGFTEGMAQIPNPHAHNYRAKYDGDAAAVIAAFNWSRSELQPEDIQ